MSSEVTTLAPVPLVRSALYVPGDRADFLAKADARDADAVIIDLEDAVATATKHAAQTIASDWLVRRTTDYPACFARISALDVGSLDDDLAAVVHPVLTGVVVPKIRSSDEVATVAEALAHYEGRREMPQGKIRIWPLVETAEAVQRAYQIAASSPRIAYMGGATGEQGDLARAIGFLWTLDGLESLFIRSKVLLDVRAAGVPNPITGMVTRLDVEAVDAFARQSRQLGYEGMMVIHPAHVPVVNAAFAPSREEIEDALCLIRLLREAEIAGKACISYKGRMVDTAMAHTAEEVVRAARRLPQSAVSEHPPTT